jgi:hypothetical protein
MLFVLLIFPSHFFPISWLSFLYVWVAKSQKMTAQSAVQMQHPQPCKHHWC